MAAEMRVLDPLVSAQKLLALIEGAHKNGILELLAPGATIPAITTATKLEAGVVAAIVDALVVGGVAENDNETFHLTKDWQAVCGPIGVRPLPATLHGERVGAELLRHVGTGDDYWSVSTDDRVALAASLSPDPIQGSLVPTLPAQAAAGEPLPAAASTANRYLELGCGVAGMTLSLLQAFPQLTVVGVELSDDLADEAERRAEVLGLRDRFTVVRSDAADFDDEEPFDLGFWSQFFFAEHTRAGALRTLFDNIRPGGLVAAPIVHPIGGEPDAVLRRISLLRVSTQSWGVPDRTPEELVEEFQTAGLVDARAVGQGKRSMLVLANRP